MESKAKRTLVKSAPELWELADDIARMEEWMGGLVGSPAPVSIEVTDRDPEHVIAWRANSDGPGRARIAIELAEGGLGTAVEITAQHSRPDLAEATLERVLDELGGADRRPYSHA